jgi:hypothetical protein
LGLEFAADFLSHYRHLARDAELYAVRFADVRRLNLDRFSYGLFYVIRAPEIWLLAVFHASRDTETVLANLGLSDAIATGSSARERTGHRKSAPLQTQHGN